MLKMIARTNAAAVVRYYFQNKEAAEDQIIGMWGGKAAETLGLRGEVDQKRFAALCHNLHPDTGERLTQRMRSNRTVGYDLAFAVPKSVSLVYGWTGDRRIVTALQEAVHETLLEVEARTETRVRVNGADTTRPTGSFCYASFIHTRTRPTEGVADDHLHAHIFIPNITRDSVEQKWKAGHFRRINESMPYYQAAMLSRFSLKLQAIGYPVERRNNAFEITTVPSSAIDKSSRRKAIIESTAAERGVTDRKIKARIGPETREPKKKQVPSTERRAILDARLSESELAAKGRIVSTYRQQMLALGQAAPPTPAPVRPALPVWPTDAERAAVDRAALHVYERHSAIEESRFYAEALRFGMCRVRPEGIRAAVAERVGMDMIRKEHDGYHKLTTKMVLAAEEAMTRYVKSTYGTVPPLAPGYTIRNEQLNDQQRAAVHHILTSRDKLCAVIGRSGVGKTTLLKEAVSAIESRGHKVVVLAPGSELARETLPKEGLGNSDTVAMFLASPARRESYRNGVWLVDEAGLLSTPTMNKLCEAAAQLNARIILAGDPMQHKPVGRGDALIILQEHADLRAAVVGKILRQTTGVFREAVQALSVGNVDLAFNKLGQMKACHEIPDEAERHSALVADYVQVVRAGKTALVISPTHREGRKVTDVIRTELKRCGGIKDERPFPTLQKIQFTEAEKQDVHSYRLGWVLEITKSLPGFRCGQRFTVAVVEDGKVFVHGSDGTERVMPVEKYGDRFDVYEPQTLQIGLNERIRISKNGVSLESRKLHNGNFYKVTGFTPEGSVKLDNGATLSRNYAHLTYGYATTSPAAQGKTVDFVFIAESPESFRAASREQLYVSISRAREGAGLYTTTIEGLKDAVKANGQRLSASDLVHGKKAAALTSDHDEEIRQAQRRAEHALGPSASPEPSKQWLGQLSEVSEQFSEYLPEHTREQINRRRSFGFGR